MGFEHPDTKERYAVWHTFPYGVRVQNLKKEGEPD